MSRFLNELSIKETNRMGERVFILERSFGYDSDILGRHVVVPVGFSTDGASVPKFIWWLYHPLGKYFRAAVIHDWFCVTNEIDYITAAKVFREAMEVCGVNKWRRNKMYWAVRLGGPKFSAK